MVFSDHLEIKETLHQYKAAAQIKARPLNGSGGGGDDDISQMPNGDHRECFFFFFFSHIFSFFFLNVTIKLCYDEVKNKSLSAPSGKWNSNGNNDLTTNL